MTVLTKSRIVEAWYQKATSTSLDVATLEAFFRFTAIWIAFNAIYGKRYPKSTVPHPKERNQVLAFARDNSSVHERFLNEDAEYQRAVDYIKANGVLNIMTATLEDLDDPKNCEHVLSCVYTIRCNFLHGDKQPNRERDRELARASYCILARLLSDPAVRSLS